MLDIEHKILPHQIEMQDVNKRVVKHNQETCIILPLNDTMKQKRKDLSTKLDDISPMLLLFLNRLRKLQIVDHLKDDDDDEEEEATGRGRLALKEGEQSSTIMERVDYPESGLVELRTTTTNSNSAAGSDTTSIYKYVVLKKVVEVASNIARDKSVLKTELAIAFAIPTSQDDEAEGKQGRSSSSSLLSSSYHGNNHHNKESSDELSKFPVFSYLPVQPYGFRFILQGDFVLSSGREHILMDDEWNLYLRSHIPQLFHEAVLKAKQPDSALSIQMILDAVPSEKDVHSFFKSSVFIKCSL
jgi:hypothetical protein